ncbi:hypothetical protein AB0395_21250 [Streptosporangium sp. NPDC051023]
MTFVDARAGPGSTYGPWLDNLAEDQKDSPAQIDRMLSGACTLGVW